MRAALRVSQVRGITCFWSMLNLSSSNADVKRCPQPSCSSTHSDFHRLCQVVWECPACAFLLQPFGAESCFPQHVSGQWKNLSVSWELISKIHVAGERKHLCLCSLVAYNSFLPLLVFGLGSLKAIRFMQLLHVTCGTVENFFHCQGIAQNAGIQISAINLHLFFWKTLCWQLSGVKKKKPTRNNKTTHKVLNGAHFMCST